MNDSGESSTQLVSIMGLLAAALLDTRPRLPSLRGIVIEPLLQSKAYYAFFFYF